MTAVRGTPDVRAHQALREAYSGRRVLVVGGDGFLGLNCVYALRELGADVSVLSRRPTPRAAGVCSHLVRGSLGDEGVVRAAVQAQDIVFDFAGSFGAVASNRDPHRSLEDECRPHLNLFHACATTASAPMVVFCSTRLVYGRPRYLPVDEVHPISPQSIYAVHKVTLEHYLRVLASTDGLRFCVLRLSNAYGPNAPDEWKGYGIINEFVRLAALGTPITVYGDGSQRRDYVYVDDAIVAFLMCAVTEACAGHTFNLGGRAVISVREAAVEVARAFAAPPIRFAPWPEDYRGVETGDYQTDLSKLERAIRLPPQLSFREGIGRMLGSMERRRAVQNG